jgi:hypothetical protein
MQLRSACLLLNADSPFAKDDKCPFCGECEETTAHLLAGCPTYFDLRLDLLREIEDLNLDIPIMMMDPDDAKTALVGDGTRWNPLLARVVIKFTRQALEKRRHILSTQ